jgi:hypothetical protein
MRRSLVSIFSTRAFSAGVFSASALLVAACSSDKANPGTATSGGAPQTSVETNKPAGGSGGGAGAGTAAGRAGSPGEGQTAPGGLSQNGSAGRSGGGAATPPAAATDAGSNTPPAVASDAGANDTGMTFFVTSRGIGTGGNFGGLAGADAFCTTLATAANPALAAKTWHAYLSTSTENARDRIGTGPWRNFNGRVIANSVAQLHDQAMGQTVGRTLDQTWPPGDATVALDERGNQVPLNPVLHDILTGSNLDGTLSMAGTCNDWTSTMGTTQNGHANRGGQGQNPPSWNSAHATGCGQNPPNTNMQQGTVSQGGGRGSIYCFAID